MMTLKKLSIRINALSKSMEAIRLESTPDHSKWAGAPSFARTHAEIAKEYSRLTGDLDVHFYDTENLKSWADMVWTSQKVMFDNTYFEVIALKSQIDEIISVDKSINMYNLFVSGLDDAWEGRYFQIENTRCIKEYTSKDISARFSELDKLSIAELTKLPSIFAYEVGLKRNPKFGYITDIVSRQGNVRVEYEVIDVASFLSADDMRSMAFELDIAKHELYRTHWAVKNVNLAKELRCKNIEIPIRNHDVCNAVDISDHIFSVALSFPGELRSLVEGIVVELERRLGPNSYFYDNNYKSQLARPELDILLQNIYDKALLNVVFLGVDYQKSNWCGVEFRIIKDAIFRKENSKVMYIRVDDGSVDGVSFVDGYIDARQHDAVEIAKFICERVSLNSK